MRIQTMTVPVEVDGIVTAGEWIVAILPSRNGRLYVTVGRNDGGEYVEAFGGVNRTYSFGRVE